MSGNTLMMIGIAMAALGVFVLCLQLAAMKNRDKRAKQAASAADLPAAPVVSAPRRAEKMAASAATDEATVKLSPTAEKPAASRNEEDNTICLEG